MARIAGITLPDNKRVDIALTILYGIGRKNVVAILRQAGLDVAKRVRDLTGEEITRIQKAVDQIPIEGDLRKMVAENIARLKKIGSYRGIRHFKGLPVRGQRTRSNARTKRGKRKTIGAIKKEDATKLGVSAKEEKKNA